MVGSANRRLSLCLASSYRAVLKAAGYRMPMEETFEQRAERRRRTWTARLGAEQLPARVEETTVAERVSHMSVVSESAWALAGLPIPEYTRASMPGRVFRACSR